MANQEFVLPSDLGAKEWDFTGFFLPLIQEHCLPGTCLTIAVASAGFSLLFS
jgi:hypothetical protein